MRNRRDSEQVAANVSISLGDIDLDAGGMRPCAVTERFSLIASGTHLLIGGRARCFSEVCGAGRDELPQRQEIDFGRVSMGNPTPGHSPN